MVLLDNIIFELQKAGGVSLVWNSILNACFNDLDIEYTLLDSGKGRSNIFYPQISPTSKIILDRGPLLLRRYRDISKNIQTSIFHSSYFRVHKNKKVKNIVTVHDFVYEKFDKGLRKHIHLIQKKHALYKSDAIICVSENTKNDLLEYCPSLSNRDIRVIYNGRSNEYFPLEGSLYNESARDESSSFLLYIGGRNAHKNFSAVLKLLDTTTARKMNLKLNVVGGGVFTKEELSQLHKLKLAERVTHLGFVDNKTLNQLYNSAFAFVYPSFYEGFGIPPLEAMSAGCPVICSNVSSIPEIAGNAGLLFDPEFPESAEDFLIQLQDTSMRDGIVQKGLQRSMQFSWEKTGKETVQLYKEML